ncbi:hypothetical protein HOLleu_08693 [Holothuria leucospilota]|uniref:PHD-type domain-containing protein n=2 Tax=Holothuria leucospilota TaxID=206669 RepID=A0A9Q0YDW9_HOLLE|nr:hypothetical protein HOLleu_40161 [Holothuria leucospilota]KAJ8045647.1 hypothetical protein HOLleu_08693 [Holothuria leucospilota]
MAHSTFQRKASTSQVDKGRKSRDKCGDCGAVVNKDDKGIQCELCELWFHASCQNILESQYQALVEDSKNDSPVLHWFCCYCNRSAVKILNGLMRMQQQIDDLQQEVQASGSRLNDIEAGKFTDNMSSAVGEIASKKVMESSQAVRRDVLDMEKRRMNAVIFGLSESGSGDPEIRKSHDAEAITELLGKLNINTIRPTHLFRIGAVKERPQGSLVKPRPLKLVFQSEWEKQEVMSKFIDCKKAKSNYVAELTIGHDKTKWEQEEYNKLKAELTARLDRGEQDLVIRDLKIVSRFRRQQSQ